MSLTAYRFGPSPGRENPWDAELLVVSPGNTLLAIPGEDFVLHASYERLGPDLLLSGDGHSVLVKGYFTHQRVPDLYTNDGNSFVSGSEAASLAGPATPARQKHATPAIPVQPIPVTPAPVVR